MSHSVVITVDNVKHSIETCDKYSKYFHEMLNNEMLDRGEIENKLDELNNIKKQLIDMVGKSSNDTLNLFQTISTISKEASNLYANFNYVEKLSKGLEKENSFDISKEISKHGTLAVQAIEHLKTQGLRISQNSFDNTLDSIREQMVDDKQLKELKSINLEIISNSKMPINIKNKLNMKVHLIKNNQELSDLAPFIESKSNEIDYVKSIVETISNSFRTEKFLAKEITWDLDENQVVEVKLKMANVVGNNVIIKINADGVIRYKLGNYIGHACEKTSDRLWSDLTKNGYVITDKKIKRECGESIPMSKEFFNNEGSM